MSQSQREVDIMEVAKQREVKGEWNLGPVRPDTSFHHAPPPVRKYSSTRVCLLACVRACVHALCIFYLLVMVAVGMVLLEPTSIAKLPILLRKGGTTVILSDISQGQSLLLHPSVYLFHRRGADETTKWIQSNVQWRERSIN